MPYWVKFDQTKRFSLREYSMRSSVYSNKNQNGDYRTSFQAWIQRDPDSSLPRATETLFEHKNIWKLVFDRGSYDKLTMYNFQHQDLQVTFPRGHWVYIASYHDYNGYALHVQDEYGNIYSDGNVKHSYYQGGTSFSTNTNILIAESFSGFIQGIKYFKGV